MNPRHATRRAASVLGAAVLALGLLAGCSDEASRESSAPSTEPSSRPSGTTASDAADGSGTTASTDSEATEWLYVVDADSGSATADTVTLTAADPDAIAFSDRPERVVRRVPTDELVSTWDSLGFTDDPPNATVAYERGGQEQLAAVELTDASMDGADLVLSYTPLDEGAPSLPRDLGPVSVFIDDAAVTTEGVMTTGPMLVADYLEVFRSGDYTCADQGPVELCQSQTRISPEGAEPYVEWRLWVAVSENTRLSVDAWIDVPEDLGYEWHSRAEYDEGYVELTWASPAIPAQDRLSVDIDVTTPSESYPFSCDTSLPAGQDRYAGSCRVRG